MSSVLVSGANGFVGRVLCDTLLHKGHKVTAAVRSAEAAATMPHLPTVVMGDVDADTQWQSALEHIDVVIHLVARVHIMQDRHENPLAEFRKINVAGSINLARQAAGCGVKRLIYLSSIKVHGESTEAQAFTVADVPNPQDPYGISKWEAEQALQHIANSTAMQTVIIRSPLIYGPGVKGNFQRLLRVLQKNIPLPLAAVENRRSLVNLDNLCDLISCCVTHPAAAGQVFLVSDQQDLSTPDLLRLMAKVLGLKLKLLPIPVSCLRLLAKCLGKSAEIDRLCGSLQVDIQHTRKLLNWKPPYTVEQGISRTIADSSASLI